MLFTQFKVSVNVPIEELDIVKLRELVDDYGFGLFTISDTVTTISCVLETKSLAEFKLKISHLEAVLSEQYGDYNVGKVFIDKNWTTVNLEV